MGDDRDVEQLREVMRILGDSLPNLLKSLTDMTSDPKRVAAFAASTAEFYKQLKDAGVPDDKAAELTKVFMERANPMGPLGALFGSGPGDLGKAFGGNFGDFGPSTRKGKMVFRVGGKDSDDEEDAEKDAEAGTKDRAASGGSSGRGGRD